MEKLLNCFFELTGVKRGSKSEYDYALLMLRFDDFINNIVKGEVSRSEYRYMVMDYVYGCFNVTIDLSVDEMKKKLCEAAEKTVDTLNEIMNDRTEVLLEACYENSK